MDITIHPRILSGTVAAIPSKSQAHRILICAAFSDGETTITCPETNQDIEATAGCLRALGADITRTECGYIVRPVTHVPASAELDCVESGSTLRFMLPVVGALGVDATFLLSGRLPNRPLSPLWEEMERMGCCLSRPTKETIHCCGQLCSGQYQIDGSVSSQFITGLLFALALIPGSSSLEITGKIESKPYIDLTCSVLAMFGIDTGNFCINGCYPFTSPESVDIEGDWSNAAFFLTAKFIGNNVEVTGLNSNSAQGDRAVTPILSSMHQPCIIDAADIPDLVPTLAVAAASSKGAVFENIGRLRLKESDRVESVACMLRNLGANVTINSDTMIVSPAAFHGCTIDAVGDHRIAMSAAIAATIAAGPVTIIGADCVSKSYPGFWDAYHRLGGYYEQYLR